MTGGGDPGAGASRREPGLRPEAGRPAVAGFGAVARLVLPSGLTLLVRENWGAPVVALTLLSRGGSAEEAPELNGVTALLGRVLLKGTRTRKAIEVASAAEDAGGGIESGADQEYGELRAWGLARHWPRLLSLLHEVATEPRFGDEEIERERGVLLAQIRGLEDQPAQVANRVLGQSLFGAQGYGLPSSGEEATVARLGRADLFDRCTETYAADRLVLAISGAVTADEVLGEAGRLFEGLRPRGAAVGAPPPPERPIRLRQRQASPTQQAHLLLGYLAPPVGASDHVALKVANGVLGGGMSSRLFQEIREERGLCYSVYSWASTYADAGCAGIYAGTAPSRVAELLDVVDDEIAKMTASGVSEGELAVAKGYLEGSLLLGLEDSGSRMARLGRSLMARDEVVPIEEQLARIRAVTTDDVAAVSARVFGGPRSLAVIGHVDDDVLG
jgi:predicted Zn-dependent peptidase